MSQLPPPPSGPPGPPGPSEPPGWPPAAPPSPYQPPQRYGGAVGIGVVVGILLPIAIGGLWLLVSTSVDAGSGIAGTLLYWVALGLPVLLLGGGLGLLFSERYRRIGVAMLTAAGVGLVTSAGLCVAAFVFFLSQYSQGS